MKIQPCWDGLRECKNTRLIVELEARVDDLMGVLGQVEWVESWPKHQHRCAWCKQTPQDDHALDCGRQAAIAKVIAIREAR